MCIYVRELTIEEGRKIQSLLRRGQNAIQVRRAMVILSSAQGYKVPEIARRYYLSEKYVRALIHRFNAEGVRSLNP
ncbi:MAG: helix-turn-helix domain-containing protein, partial [Methanophagales archaeon ANME-1-THS]